MCDCVSSWKTSVATRVTSYIYSVPVREGDYLTYQAKYFRENPKNVALNLMLRKYWLQVQTNGNVYVSYQQELRLLIVSSHHFSS